MSDIASENKSHTVIFPVPVDLMGSLQEVVRQMAQK